MVASELDIRSRDTKAERPPLSITAPHRTALHGPAPHRSSPLRMASILIARRCKNRAPQVRARGTGQRNALRGATPLVTAQAPDAPNAANRKTPHCIAPHYTALHVPRHSNPTYHPNLALNTAEPFADKRVFRTATTWLVLQRAPPKVALSDPCVP